MGTINNGSQVMTFDFKQSGTSEGFNKLYYKLLPSGILSGGGLTKVTDTSVIISPFLSLYDDNNKGLCVRLETTEDATVTVNTSAPYIVGRFDWLNVVDNYMDFKAVSFANIDEDDIILGRCIYNNNTLINFDYSMKSWSKDYYENTMSKTPNFLVTACEPYSNKVQVHRGKAIIGGRLVELNTVTESDNISSAITNSRKDIVTIDIEGNINIIKGIDEVNAKPPKCPTSHLLLAILSPTPNFSALTGDMIDYVYNNNYISEDVDTSVKERDKPIEDTGETLTFTSSGGVVLSNTNTTRNLSNGLWVGQSILLQNSSSNDITITSPKDEATENYTVKTQDFLSLWWNGTRWWNTDVPIDFIYTQYPFTKNPLEIYGTGEWEDISNTYEGAYFRALGGDSADWEALQEESLPNIVGSINSVGFEHVDTTGVFTVENGQVYTHVSAETGDAIVSFDASLQRTSDNRQIYGLSEHVTPKSYAIKIWKKTAH